MRKLNIIVTLGPTSLNKKFLNFVNNKNVSLVRLNMSHVKLSKLEEKLIFVKKHCKVPICVDTEGAQIRTILNGIQLRKVRVGEKIKIKKESKKFNFYPREVFELMKKNDLLDVGFEGLQLKVVKSNNSCIDLKCTNHD